MAISIADLHTVRATLPPRVLIYGPPGIGKTSLAAEWPNAVFLQVEDGTPSDLELTSFGKLMTHELDDGSKHLGYDQVIEAIISLYNEEHAYQTVVLDSLDKLEPMVWEKTCIENNWQNIETPGYGKGYVSADQYWHDMIEGLNALRTDKQMNIVYIAHSSIDTVNDPLTASYSRYDIRLHKRAVAIFQDEVDAVLFINQDVSLLQNDPKAKSGPGARVRAAGGGNRFIHATPRPAYVAKNRYSLPDKIQYEKAKGWSALASYFPGANEQAAEPEAPLMDETVAVPPARKSTKRK